MEKLLLKNLRENLQIGNIVLRNFINLTPEEKKIVLMWRNNDDIRKVSYSSHIISEEEHNRFMKELKRNNKNYYLLAKDKENKCLGVISLNRVDFFNKHAYLGIYTNPQLKGGGSLLMKCLKELAFRIAKLHTLKLEVIKSNHRAISFYKKEGFEEEGRLKEFVYKDGRWFDVIVMGLINRND